MRGWQGTAFVRACGDVRLGHACLVGSCFLYCGPSAIGGGVLAQLWSLPGQRIWHPGAIAGFGLWNQSVWEAAIPA